MEFKLKPLSRESIPTALERALRYRLLNEPRQAESICLDVLELEPGNLDAVVTLLLALTDQIERFHGDSGRRAKELLDRLPDDYRKTYYAGVICERQGVARLRRGGPGTGYAAYELLRQAMDHYEAAEKLRPAGNDEAILRWNTCARIIMSEPSVQPQPQESFYPLLE
jgi:hypothetical protein